RASIYLLYVHFLANPQNRPVGASISHNSDRFTFSFSSSRSSFTVGLIVTREKAFLTGGGRGPPLAAVTHFSGILLHSFADSSLNLLAGRWQICLGKSQEWGVHCEVDTLTKSAFDTKSSPGGRMN
ncbi:hypothetical protein PMAYCL1PPCAC_29407, partial [Pristionchus mayeri]